MRSITALIFLLVAITSFPQNNQTQLLESATTAFENGNIDLARKNLEQIPLANQSRIVLQKLLLIAQLEESEGYFEKAISFNRQAKKLSNTLNNAFAESAAILGIASAFIELGKTDSVLSLADAAQKIDSTQLNGINILLINARYWHSMNQPSKALPHYQAALEKAKNANAISHEIQSMAGMASIYFTLEPNMKRVINILSEVIERCDSSKHANQIARNCARMANANMVLGNLPKAEAFLNRAKAITDLTHNMPVESYVLSSLAILRSEQGNIEEAIKISSKAIQQRREMGQIKQLQNDLINTAEWQMHLKQYTQAEATIEEGIKASSFLKDYVYLFYYYRHLSTLDSITGKFPQAYSHLKKATVYKDSTIALQNAKAVSEIREKYETEQREKLLAEKGLEIQQQRSRIITILAVTVILILSFIVILVMVRNRHKARFAFEKQAQNKLRLQTIINTQEEVQQDIARDIHDGLVQMMGAAKLSLQAIRPGDEFKNLMEKTSRASAIIDDACMEARNISHQLLPHSLMREGFSSALRELVTSSFATYTFESERELELDQELAINLFRISQEIVNNINKHAEASLVKVTLKHSDKHLSLIFEDNGKGFDPTKVKKGAGLINIMTRAELIGGTVDITSQPGKGSHLNISVAL
jgi:signal transduction histidine kinase